MFCKLPIHTPKPSSSKPAGESAPTATDPESAQGTQRLNTNSHRERSQVQEHWGWLGG